MPSLLRKFVLFDLRLPAREKKVRRRPPKKNRYERGIKKARLCNQVLRSAMRAQEKQYEAKLRRAKEVAHRRELDYHYDYSKGDVLITARVDQRTFRFFSGQFKAEKIMDHVVREFSLSLKRDLETVGFTDLMKLCEQTQQGRAAMALQSQGGQVEFFARAQMIQAQQMQNQQSQFTSLGAVDGGLGDALRGLGGAIRGLKS